MKTTPPTTRYLRHDPIPPCYSARRRNLVPYVASTELCSALIVDFHEHFFCLFLHLGILQHSLRDCLVAAGDGAIWGDQRFGFDCPLDVHGGTGIGVVGKRQSDPTNGAEDPLSAPRALCGG